MDEQGRLYRVVIPDGTHLSESTDTPGAKRALARDDCTNRLSGHAELIPVEDDDLALRAHETDPAPRDRTGELSPAQRVIADVLAVVAVHVVDEVLIPLGKRLWAERVAPAVDRRLSRIPRRRRSAAEQEGKETASTELAVPAGAQPADTSNELDAANEARDIAMSASEFRERLFAALTAQAILDEQITVLSAARIEDDDLSATLMRGIRRVLEGNASSLEEEESVELVRFLREGQVVDGHYVLRGADESHEVLRLPAGE